MKTTDPQDLSFEEIALKFATSAEAWLAGIKNVSELLRSWVDLAFNEIVDAYFQKDQETFWEKETFQAFLIENLEAYISFCEYLEHHRLSGEEDEKKNNQMNTFEAKYHKILYFGQVNRFESRTQSHQVNRTKEKTSFMGQVRETVERIVKSDK